MQIKYQLIRETKEPQNRKGDNGIDFFVPRDFYALLYPNQIISIPLGVVVELPENVFLYGCNRSSLGLKGLNVMAPLVDSNYRGELHCVIQNVTQQAIEIIPDMKITQFVPIRQESFQIEKVDEISIHTNRGIGAFGSTNTK